MLAHQLIVPGGPADEPKDALFVNMLSELGDGVLSLEKNVT